MSLPEASSTVEFECDSETLCFLFLFLYVSDMKVASPIHLVVNLSSKFCIHDKILKIFSRVMFKNSTLGKHKGPTGAAGAPRARIGGRAPGALRALAGALSRIKKVEKVITFRVVGLF